MLLRNADLIDQFRRYESISQGYWKSNFAFRHDETFSGAKPESEGESKGVLHFVILQSLFR